MKKQVEMPNEVIKGDAYTFKDGVLSKLKGKNIRFSLAAHKKISDYCRLNGYNLGAFCEKTVARYIDADMQS